MIKYNPGNKNMPVGFLPYLLLMYLASIIRKKDWKKTTKLRKKSLGTENSTKITTRKER